MSKTDNELIAEFMGATIHKEKFGGSGSCARTWTMKTFSEPLYGSEMEYSTSWDWLMPVVEKIGEPDIKNGHSLRTAADVYINYKACHIEYMGDEESGDNHGEWSIDTQGETKIGAVYKAVVQFIKWYNKQKR